MSSLGGIVVVALTIISDYSEFSTLQQNIHSGGIVTQNRIRLLRQFVPFSGPAELVQARVGGMEECFAHYRRRLPAGSLCSTITALWGCLTEAKEREQQRQRVWKCLVGWYLYLHHSMLFLSLVLNILLCPHFSDTQTSLSNFFPSYFSTPTSQASCQGPPVTHTTLQW